MILEINSDKSILININEADTLGNNSNGVSKTCTLIQVLKKGNNETVPKLLSHDLIPWHDFQTYL